MAAFQACLSEQLKSPSGTSTTFSESSSMRWSDVTESESDSLQTTPRSLKSSPSVPVCYPSDLVVRNTFLDFAEETAVIVQRRRARSLEPVRRSTCDEETSISNVGVGSVGNNVMYKATHTSGRAAEPAGNAALPSEGSRLHSSGACRPCGFFWKSTGCSNGERCQFCHLCGSQEKRTRHKAKKAMLKAQAASKAAAGLTTQATRLCRQ
eukprot:TRINITY_DN80801_c0_g1_i1.p1 TRINITY_DN80801_c0_g1~~TRINITY_DN80801_c0_g1_i1.p1  ORF type:complete len:209 (+),score=43.52 TRINITY_DN80801_c0_g1_i1:118-744(+)